MNFEERFTKKQNGLPPFYCRCRRGLCLILLCACQMFLLGCNSINQALSKVVPFYSYDKTTLSDISITSDAGSNNSVPVAIDFVFIFDETVTPVLQNLKGPEWFANKAGLLLQYDKKLALAHVEIVPLTAKHSISLPDGYDDAVKVLMFANYIHVSGQVIADLTLFDELQITLGKSAYQLKELNP
ncbi:hypothetical protein [Thalassomonas haliotis]|uniref:Type VI secretion system lipoprotein TssJ n=1 Tax=Thalassomonas haliotis TaxID=485448 RepID=A0ABY7V8M1_9GAMM|nr:hypothetical protein [Thalassomonas haliotis]WDE09384.1 hypothetical protein H3N35_13660 [Thalassomonas haliotis]